MLTKEEIVKGNIAIALFMGWRIDNSFPDKGRVYRLGGRLELDTTFKFHQSWDALMPCVIKCESYIYVKDTICPLYGKIFRALNDIDLTRLWMAVVYFVENYEKQLQINK